MRTTGRAADRDQKRRSGSYDLPFLADRAKKGVTGKEGYEGNGLSRRRQGFKSPWGRQRNYALTRNRKGFFIMGQICPTICPTHFEKILPL